MVSGNYFTMLGVKPAAGRVFESRTKTTASIRAIRSVVLSYDYWVSRFDRDPKVVGKKILVNNYPMTIVGVSAQGFAGLDPARSPQIRVPILMKPVMVPEWGWVEWNDRRTRWVQVFARLKPGYTVESAQAADAGAVPSDPRIRDRRCRPRRTGPPTRATSSCEGTIHVEKAATGYSDLRNNFSTALIVLMCMVGLVLLIACANVANLLIARAFARQKEIAVRLSIGASRGQLVRPVAGREPGAVVCRRRRRGSLLAHGHDARPAGARADRGQSAADSARAGSADSAVHLGADGADRPDLRLVPALRASRPDLWTTLKDAVGSIAGAGGSLFLRKGLVAAQVALSFLLLFGAGLFVRSLQNLKATDTGFRDLDNLVTFQLSPALNGYDAARRSHLLPGTARSHPGSFRACKPRRWPSCRCCTAGNGTAASGGRPQAEGRRRHAGVHEFALARLLRDHGHSAAGGPRLRPRDIKRRFESGDREPAVRRALSSGTRAPWGGISGAEAAQDRNSKPRSSGWWRDSLYEGPREGVRRQVFVPNWGNGGVAFYVRAGMGSSSAYAAVRSEVKKLDASMPVYEMKTLAAQLDQTLLTERLIALLSAGFGMLATLLAAIGLYGVMAFVVARRTKELGVRMALGAQPPSVIWLVMREVLLLLAIGLAVGVPAAFALGRFVASAALRDQSERSLERRGQHDGSDPGSQPRGIDSGAARQPDRSDSGAALRVIVVPRASLAARPWLAGRRTARGLLSCARPAR